MVDGDAIAERLTRVEAELKALRELMVLQLEAGDNSLRQIIRLSVEERLERFQQDLGKVDAKAERANERVDEYPSAVEVKDAVRAIDRTKWVAVGIGIGGGMSGGGLVLALARAFGV